MAARTNWGGRVIKGQRLGRTLDTPTANLRFRCPNPAVRGVFAVRVRREAGDCFGGVANLGTRPTLGAGVMRLEVHLFDFDGDLYGEHLEVEFVSAIRPEQKFDSFDALKAQIALDKQRAAQAARW